MQAPGMAVRGAARRFVTRPEFSTLLILVVMFVLTAVLQQNFFETKSIVRNINAFTPLILITMGQAVVILAGGIDLSAGRALALAVAFAVAMAVGIINGIGIGYLRIPPVIATFATSFIWLGAALFLRPTPGGEAVEWFKAFYNIGDIAGVSSSLHRFSDVIPPALLLVIIGCLFWAFVSRTRTGRYIYAVGSSNDGAYESGIDTARVQLKACLVNSVFIVLAALFFVGQN